MPLLPKEHKQLNDVLLALKSLRPTFYTQEEDIHTAIAHTLSTHHIDFRHEYFLNANAKIDFFIDGLGIEVKKGKPLKKALLAQLQKYSQSQKLYAMIVVVQQSIALPKTIDGVPVFALSLYQNYLPCF